MCWHKFVRYWDIEERSIPIEGNRYVMDPERAAAACDENTIGVVSVLGSTFTGEYEDVAGLSAALDGLEEKTGLDIPIHVDGASGGLCGSIFATRTHLGFPFAAREVDQYFGA